MSTTTTVFDLEQEKELIKHFGILEKSSSSTIKLSDLLEKYKHNEEFINLCKMITTSSKSQYVSPIIIPILEELDINKDTLYWLVARWMDCDEDKYIAYNLMKKNCPGLMRKNSDFINITDTIYVKDFIKILSDINEDCKIEFGIFIRPSTIIEADFDDVDNINFEGKPHKAIQKMINEYLLSDACQILFFYIDGEKSFDKMPFCYFSLDDF